jgi:hypothetical protein
MQASPPPIDIRSALVGLGLAGSLILLTSLARPTPPVKTVRISLDPDPSSIVRIEEGETFTVPQNLRLVLKATGSTQDGLNAIELQINGETVFSNGGASELGAFAFPLVAQPGDVVTVLQPFSAPESTPYVTGYLSE